MGGSLSSLFTHFWGREVKVMMLGLENAGKTTILKRLKLGASVATVIPTIGFNVETIPSNGINFTLWDVGRLFYLGVPLWDGYFKDCNALIIVVDAADRAHLAEAVAQIHRMVMGRDSLRGVPVLIFSNKQDMPNAMSTAEVADALELHRLSESMSMPWFVQPCTGLDGVGLSEGVAWLASILPSPEAKEG
jgi:small GTP-binding protein